MCEPTDPPPTPTPKETVRLAEDGVATKPNEEETDEDKASEEAPREYYSWWRGGGMKPRNGQDLGVWEKSLEDQAGFVELFLLSFLNPLLDLGSRKVLNEQDVGVPSAQDRSERVFQDAKMEWDSQLAHCKAVNSKREANYQVLLDKCTTEEAKEKVPKPKLEEPSMSWALITSFGGSRIAFAMMAYFMSAVLTFGPVLLLRDLVKYFEHVKYFQSAEPGSPEKEYEGLGISPWVAVVLLGVIPVVSTMMQTRYQSTMAHCGIFVRTAVSLMLYQKSLSVSAGGRAKTSTGQVVNMMSNDTMQLQRFLQFGGMTLVAPVQIGVALFLIYREVGNAMWVGVAYMVFLAPINVWVFGVVSKMRREVLKYSDMRVKMMNEILTGIRILKFYAWEKPFGKEVGQIRAKEMEALTRLAYVVAVGFSIVLLSTPIIQPIIVFMTYVKIQTEPLSASTAFTTVALFNIMRFPFAFMPMGLLQYIQSRISLKRLERYLSLPELTEYVDHDPSHVPPLVIAEDDQTVQDAEASDDKDKASEAVHQHDYTVPGSVTIQNGTFSWFDPSAAPIKPVQDEEPAKTKRPSRAERRASRKSSKAADASDKASTDNLSASVHSVSTATSEGGTSKVPVITLKDITCRIPAGSLVAVVGAVGSGKSSFLSAILGEMEPIDGSKVYLPGLGANQPGSDDKTTMQDKKVGGIAYCTQSPWVVNDTLRGNILFGREFKEERYEQVLEACALKDDLVVLPAGDMTEIGERGINLSGGQKARVSLARALYWADTKLLLLDDPLSAVDAHVGAHLFREVITGDVSRGMTRILVTHHVHVLTRCDMVVIMERGQIKHQGSYDELVAKGVDFAGAVDTSKMKKVPSSPALAVVAEEAVEAKGEAVASKEATGTKAEQDEKVAAEAKTAKTQAAVLKKAGEKLVKDEEREEGTVDSDAYIRYIRAGGYCIALTMLFVQVAGRVSEIMASFWLALWADRSLEAVKDGTPFTDAETSFHLGMYALLGFLGVCGLGVRGIFMAAHRLHASKAIHDDLTQSILRAPVAFFDVTPIGRVLNRFAADMDKVDLELTQTISQGVNTMMQVIGAFGAILIATKGTFIVALVPIGIMYYFVQKWFRKTSTELQRVTSIANSPIFADFSQTLSGTSTIRAYGVQQGFFNHCKSSFDNMNSSYVLVQLSSYWLALRLDTMGGLVAVFIGAVAVGTLKTEFIPAGWLGLALSYSIEVTSYLKFGVQMIAQLEAHMSSVERILFYTDHIKPEAPDLIPGSDPEPGKWPTGGEIEFQNASMRYRDGPLVLQDLSFKVNAGEKVGVCGRTGSGKSSLMIALFRISELENDGGKVLIDGVDTSTIGTEPLRLNLSIIPQDPVMFSNTVRYNLDPFQYADDEELWTVLRKVSMADAIAELPKGLDEPVAEGGENFSQGQRQLLCIARSLLRNPRILVMDEATASIDNETDANIQEMIRENFKDATVLTIAHRLNTIMDCDRILVLDGGRIAELDSPENLLNKTEGHFKTMVDKSRAAHDGDGAFSEAA